MSFRRDSKPIIRWVAFRESNAKIVATSGIPEDYFVSEPVFMHFLLHGCIPGDSRDFSIHDLTQDQFDYFVNLVREYFRYGYDYFTPSALVSIDLMQQFDKEFGAAIRE